MEITGKIIQALPVQEGISKAGKPWKKRYYVLETQDTYPKKVAFYVFGEDRVNEFERTVQVGMLVRVSIDIESREWQGRWFTDISCWKVENAAAAAEPAPQNFATAPAPAAAVGSMPPPPEINVAGPTDDLPF